MDAMDRWEYQVISMSAQTDWQTGIGLRKADLPDDDLQDQLNRLGELGWECIAFTPDTWKGGVNSYTVSTYHAIFKRRVS
jgi:hypothetical protein